MKRELTVLLEENTTLTEGTITEETNQDNDEEQAKEEEEKRENTNSGHVVDLKQICEEEKESDAVENDEEETDAVQEEEGTDQDQDQEQEQEEVDEDGENDTYEDEADNESEEDANDENVETQNEAVSKPPSRMTTVKMHRLDSEISTAVGKMVADDNKSMKSTTSRRTVRSRSKSEVSLKVYWVILMRVS